MPDQTVIANGWREYGLGNDGLAYIEKHYEKWGKYDNDGVYAVQQCSYLPSHK